MDADRFDGLAKSLATGASRRRVLKGLGSAVGAAGLAAVGRGAGRAAPGANRACAHFCTATFGGDTAAQAACTSAAAHGTGPCYSCAGPRGQPCPDGETCASGACVAACTPFGQACDTRNAGACCSQCCACSDYPDCATVVCC